MLGSQKLHSPFPLPPSSFLFLPPSFASKRKNKEIPQPVNEFSLAQLSHILVIKSDFIKFTLAKRPAKCLIGHASIEKAWKTD